MQNQVVNFASPRMTCIHQMVSRGMIQSLTVPQKKAGAGRVVISRRSPDLSQESIPEYRHLPKIFEVMGSHPENTAFYCGFDPTADSLHLGHTPVLSVLLNLAKSGQPIIALIGGVTSRLGDPEGKTRNRTSIGHQKLDSNAAALQEQITRIFTNFAKKHELDADNLRVLNNVEWYKNMSFADYQEIVAAEFKVTDMLNRAVVKSRLNGSNSDMRFSEFVYQTFQAYDWLHLYKHYNCAFQVGGYDQIGNIEDGYRYVWKVEPSRPSLAGITVPLMVTENGEKLGKTAGNAIWLNQIECSSVMKYLKNLSQRDLLSLSKTLTHEPLESLERAAHSALAELVIEGLSEMSLTT